jgi:hypothetical protein
MSLTEAPTGVAIRTRTGSGKSGPRTTLFGFRPSGLTACSSLEILVQRFSATSAGLHEKTAVLSIHHLPVRSMTLLVCSRKTAWQRAQRKEHRSLKHFPQRRQRRAIGRLNGHRGLPACQLNTPYPTSRARICGT